MPRPGPLSACIPGGAAPPSDCPLRPRWRHPCPQRPRHLQVLEHKPQGGGVRASRASASRCPQAPLSGPSVPQLALRRWPWSHMGKDVPYLAAAALMSPNQSPWAGGRAGAPEAQMGLLRGVRVMGTRWGRAARAFLAPEVMCCESHWWPGSFLEGPGPRRAWPEAAAVTGAFGHPL